MAEMRTAHPYHLYDAIQAQPALVEKVLARREILDKAAKAAAEKKRIVFVGVGTSRHAAQTAERWLRHFSGGRAMAAAEQSFEFVHYPLELGSEDAVFVLTHTGTTTQSVEALRAARAAGALTIAVTGQNPGAGIQGADYRIETCEQEVAFVYTKSHTTTLAALAWMILRICEEREGLKDASAWAALERVPVLMSKVLLLEARTKEIAAEVARRDRLFFFGAGAGWWTACEGALKVREASYLTSEGFQTEEVLHGPLSEMDSRGAILGLLAGEPADERARQVLRAVGELGMLRVAVPLPAANRDLAAQHVLEVPDAPCWLAPLVHMIPLQLLTYYVALARGTNPDTGRQEQPDQMRAKKHYSY